MVLEEPPTFSRKRHREVGWPRHSLCRGSHSLQAVLTPPLGAGTASLCDAPRGWGLSVTLRPNLDSSLLPGEGAGGLGASPSPADHARGDAALSLGGGVTGMTGIDWHTLFVPQFSCL